MDFKAKPNPLSSVDKVIGIVSGKGGGKVACHFLLAVQMQRRGHQAAILDADITGPSIPKMFGLSEMARRMSQASSRLRQKQE